MIQLYNMPFKLRKIGKLEEFTVPDGTHIYVESEKPKIYFFTGAGLSAPSGIPTFRTKGGLWTQYDVNRVCNINTFVRNREEVFEFYNKIYNKYSNAEPNKAHKFIADVQNKFGSDRVHVITQNIDDLLERAGCTDVLHLHGKIGYMQCGACTKIWEGDMDVDTRCGKCGCWQKVKPYVIMFGEDVPNYNIVKRLFKKFKEKDIFVVVGTMGNVVDLDDFSGGRKFLEYYQTNYILNVMDDNHSHHIPDVEEFYGKESCETYLPRMKDFIYRHMESE